MLLDDLSNQEVAVLQATKASEVALTASELATNAETTVENAQRTLDNLVAKNILQSDYQEWDQTTHYLGKDNEYAQAVYDELYGLLPE